MDTPGNVLSLRLRCSYLYRSWWTTHYTIGLVGIISAAILTALSAPMGEPVHGEAIVRLAVIRPNAWILGVIATICGSLVTLLGPLQKAEKYWSAFHILDQAILELENELISMKGFSEKVAGARRVLQILDNTEHSSASANKASKPTL